MAGIENQHIIFLEDKEWFVYLRVVRYLTTDVSKH